MSRRPRPPSRTLIAALAAFLVLLGLSGAGIGVRACEAPLDVSGTVDVPSWISSIKNLDEIAYPAHVLLASALEKGECQPAAIALQWLKAAAHARSDAEIDQTAEGLRSAKSRSPAPAEMERDFCQLPTDGVVGARQATALRRAGFHCPSPFGPLSLAVGRGRLPDLRPDPQLNLHNRP